MISLRSKEHIRKEILKFSDGLTVSQTVVADKIGVNQGTVSRILDGEFKTLNKSVLKLCKYADIETHRAAPPSPDETVLRLKEIIDLASDLLGEMKSFHKIKT